MTIGLAIFLIAMVYFMIISRGFRIVALAGMTFAALALWFLMQPEDWKYRFWHGQQNSGLVTDPAPTPRLNTPEPGPYMDASDKKAKDIANALQRMYVSPYWQSHCKNDPGFDIRPDGSHDGSCATAAAQGSQPAAGSR